MMGAFTRSLSRRNFLRVGACGGAAGVLGWAGHDRRGFAQQPAPPGTDTGAEFITKPTQAAIDGGLAILGRSQFDDGSFADRAGGSGVGITALAGLALMAAGHQPGRGRYGKQVSKAVDYLIAAGTAGTPGFLAGADPQFGAGMRQQSAMYSHGFGCLFLAEVCGMLPDPARQKKVKALLEQTVAYTISAQNAEGGWRYDKNPPYADVSVTVAQMMALRAAKNAGVFVRKSVVDKAAQYVRECQVPDGGFSYVRGQGHSAFARSAAAIVGLYSAGIYEGKEVDRGLKYLQQFLPPRQFGFREIPPHHYFYAHYYAALAMWTAGGELWRQWFPAIRDELLSKSPAGSWVDAPYGNAYAIAMSLIILQLPNNYLPILQK